MKRSTMCAFLVLAAIAVSRPAAASPITVVFNGHLTPTVGQAAFLRLIAPSISPSTQFTISAFIEEAIGQSTAQLTLGGFTMSGNCAPCRQGAASTLEAVTWYMGSGLLSGLTASFYTTGFTFTMNQGWQSGNFNIWIEDPRTIGTNVSGTITSASVPEPSTWLLGMIGAFALSLGTLKKYGAASALRRIR